MPPETSRNDPCPCGSGKKYKKCCLAKDEAGQRVLAVSESAVSRALEWLQEHHQDAVEEAIDNDFFGTLTDAQHEEVGELPEDYLEMVYLNAFEWLLAEGGLAAPAPVGDDDEAPKDPDAPEPRQTLDLVLGEGGPLMEAEERSYLQRLAQVPMDLYEVEESVPGQGMWLISLLVEGAERVWVYERSASSALQAGHVLGARVIDTEPAVLSGAIYAFDPDQIDDLRADILGGPDGDGGDVPSAWVSACVIDDWLSGLVTDAPEDEATPSVLRYSISDWGALERTLGETPDVELDTTGQWTRYLGAGEERHIAWIAARSPEGELGVFTRNEAEADEAARWFAEALGELVRLEERISPEVGPGADDEPEPGPATESSPDPSLVEDFFRKSYQGWADEPIAALGGRTPREAASTEEGAEEVAALLESYQEKETEQARSQSRDAADLSFLWTELGLTRGD